MSHSSLEPFAQAHRIVIAANPKSGSCSGLSKAEVLRQALSDQGWQVDLTIDLNEMEAMVKEYHAKGTLRTVVSAGGDGTATAVLNRISPEIPLTIYPLGSENLLAQQYRLARDPQGLIAMVSGLAVQELDLFRANDTLFLIMASVGFDAEVVRRVHQKRKAHVTRWAYRLGILSAIGTYSWPTLEVEARVEGRWETLGTCHWLFGFNVPKYAAGIQIIDDACPDDGLIDVGMLTGSNVLIGCWNYLQVAIGTHRRSSRWQEHRVEGLRVRSLTGQGGYQLDGDFGGPLPLEILYTGKKAKLVVPDPRIG